LPDVPHGRASEEGRGTERAERPRQVARRPEGREEGRQGRRRLGEGLPRQQEVRSRIAAAAGLLAAAPLLAHPRDFGVPEPHGWIGTTNQWIQGVGLAFAVLNVAVLVWIWRSVRARGVTAQSKALLFGAILVLPVIVVFLATAHGMQESMTVE